MRVEPGADGGAAERNLAETRQRVAHAADPFANLGRVAAELLAERHRDRVHPVRATGLHDVVELARLRLERRGELLERGKQIAGDLAERGEMDCGREDVV